MKRPNSLNMIILITPILLILCTFLISSPSFAQKPKTLKLARIFAEKQNKPILMEFFRTDCDYCELANREAEQKPDMIGALQKVIHLQLDVQRDEGGELADKYKVGNTFPVFILTNLDGDVIRRWTGYNGSYRFIKTLNDALANPLTINQRVADFETNPTYKEALFLAVYYSDIDEFLKGVDYYRRAEELNGPRKDFSFEIFKNYANAVWKDIIPFEQVLTPADNVLDSKNVTDENKLMTVKIMGRLARDKNKTDQLIKYLKTGLELSEKIQTEDAIIAHDLFSADLALYEKSDTALATQIEKASLGPDWQKNPEKYFSYANWCLERKINLEEAENYARQAIKRATGGPFRARILGTIGRICEARGNLKDAESMYNAAIEADQRTEYYKTLLDNLTSSPE